MSELKPGHTSKKNTIESNYSYEKTKRMYGSYPCMCCGMSYSPGDSIKRVSGAERGIHLILDKKTRPREKTRNGFTLKYSNVQTRNGKHVVVVVKVKND